MLVVHWSPVKNTKNILKNGISKSKNGLYCFPLTGYKYVDSWWVKAFNLKHYSKHHRQYNGFIFRIKKDDLPACFDHASGHTTLDTFEMEIKNLKELELRYRERIIHKIGEKILKQNICKTKEYLKLSEKLYEKYEFEYESLDDPVLLENTFSDWLDSQSIDKYAPVIDKFLEAGKAEIEKNPNIVKKSLHDLDFLENTFSDWQIILSGSISPNRIIKIISARDEYGKVLYKNKKYKYTED
jgi:hypothetical protein